MKKILWIPAVLTALIFSAGLSATELNSNVENYVNNVLASPEFSEIQAGSCVSPETIRELLRTQVGDTLLGCRPEGARCTQNSDCCENRCTGIRCNSNAGNNR